jgi:hypothetical protein
MNMLTIAWTRVNKLPPPEPLPDAMEPPREAWLAGLLNGFCLGGGIFTCLTVVFLEAIGRLK